MCASVRTTPNFSVFTMRVTASRLRRALADIFLPIDADRGRWRVDAPPRLHVAPHERDVFLLDLAVVKLSRQFLVRGVVLRDDHQARRAAIETVHDARPLLAADAAEVGDVMEQRIHQRPARRVPRPDARPCPPACRRRSGRVLVDDRQRQRLGLRRRDRPAPVDSTTIVCPAFIGWFGFGASGRRRWTCPSLISRWTLRPRVAAEDRGEKDVEARARAVGGHARSWLLTSARAGCRRPRARDRR